MSAPPAYRPWKTGCLAKADDAEYAAVLKTVPTTTAPATLADFGYKYDAERRLVQAATGKPFAWLGQKHYDALGDAITAEVYTMLERDYGLQRRMVPVDAAPGEAQVPVFVSPDYDTCDTLLLLMQGSGAVRPGMWARALCINDSLDRGTMRSYLDSAKERGWGVVVSNPNENTAAPPAEDTAEGDVDTEAFWLATPDPEWKAGAKARARAQVPVRGSEHPLTHTEYVWDTFVRPAKASMVPVVAHSFGGKCVGRLLQTRIDEVVARVPGIALTDAINDLFVAKLRTPGTPKPTKGQQQAMRALTVNWVASELPLDTKMEDYFGCTELSAGDDRHEYTSAACHPSAVAFLDARVAKCRAPEKP